VLALKVSDIITPIITATKRIKTISVFFINYSSSFCTFLSMRIR
jgi:hypothetical protein